ncbi:MAG: HAMP domain-containing sensor histidine kinase, partial [Pseudomonadota bacterium]
GTAEHLGGSAGATSPSAPNPPPNQTRPKRSILLNLVFSALVWCILTIAVAAAVLISLFNSHIEDQVRTELSNHLIQLVSLTERSARSGTLRLRSQMADPRYDRPLSRWVWQIRKDNAVVLQSASLGPVETPNAAVVAAPTGRVGTFTGPLGRTLTGISRRVVPRFAQGAYTFSVARPSEEIEASLARFRSLVLIVLAVLGVGQIATVLWLMHTGLKPLASFRAWVAAIREGTSGRPKAIWPREIKPIADELEALETHIVRLVGQARGQAADLAHAIKTPLTVLRQIGETVPPDLAAKLTRQNDRIDAAVQRHLARVRFSGRGYALVRLASVVDDLALALKKTIELRHLSLHKVVPDWITLRCDETDLYEMIGNLLDNACNAATGAISISVQSVETTVSILIEDDGPGIPEAQRVEILKRGTRFDRKRPGHGLGLAIVEDLVELYGGNIEIGASHMGGAAFRLELPFDPGIKP